MKTKVTKFFREAPSAILLGVQVLIILAYPYLRGNLTGRVFLAIATVVMLGTVILVVRKTPALLWVSILFGIPSIVTSVMESFVPGAPLLLGLAAVFHICFYFYASYALIKYIFEDNIVTRDEWFATAAAFTVILWGFAYVFLLVNVLVPGSFTIFDQHENSFFEALFLSFTVLTSVGLSDVMPITDQGRAVVMIGEVIGLFYMAIIVSRLVAMSSAKRQSKFLENLPESMYTVKKDNSHDEL
jgi:hypothetical protein